MGQPAYFSGASEESTAVRSPRGARIVVGVDASTAPLGNTLILARIQGCSMVACRSGGHDSREGEEGEGRDGTHGVESRFCCVRWRGCAVVEVEVSLRLKTRHNIVASVVAAFALSWESQLSFVLGPIMMNYCRSLRVDPLHVVVGGSPEASIHSSIHERQ